jgi:hypothetical protein
MEKVARPKKKIFLGLRWRAKQPSWGRINLSYAKNGKNEKIG